MRGLRGFEFRFVGFRKRVPMGFCNKVPLNGGLGV